MRKALALLLASSMALSLTACGGSAASSAVISAPLRLPACITAVNSDSPLIILLR